MSTGRLLACTEDRCVADVRDWLLAEDDVAGADDEAVFEVLDEPPEPELLPSATGVSPPPPLTTRIVSNTSNNRATIEPSTSIRRRQ